MRLVVCVYVLALQQTGYPVRVPGCQSVRLPFYLCLSLPLGKQVRLAICGCMKMELKVL